MDLLNKHEDQLGRGLTYDLWKNFPMAEIFAFRDYNVGYGIYPDFTNFWLMADAAAATVGYGPGCTAYCDTTAGTAIINLAIPGGGIRLSETTADEQATIQWSGGNLLGAGSNTKTGAPFIITDTAASMRELIFECAFRVNDVTASDCAWFIGLGEEGLAANETPVTEGGVLSSDDLFGLFKPEADTTTVDLVYRLNGQTAVTHADAWKTIAADTWYHFGFRYNQERGIITPWWGTGDRSTTKMAPDTANNITAADIASSTDYFPDGEEMTPVISIMGAAGGATVNLDVRLLACAQLAPAAD